MTAFADLHCDTLYECFVRDIDLSDPSLHIHSAALNGFERFIQTFAHFIPENTPEKWEYLKQFIQNSYSLLEKAEIDIFDTAADLIRTRLAVLSVEGGDLFESVVQAEERIRWLRNKGICFFSMIYNHTNRLGCGARSSVDNGLTKLGSEVLQLLEQNGIVPDVSHASYQSTEDILNLACGPVCATHSNAFALTAHPRNLSNEHLKRIALSGGLVGINFYPAFLSLQSAQVSDIIRHIKYLTDRCGEAHVAFGCDFDGVGRLPAGIQNVTSLEQLYFKMKQSGFCASVLDKLFFDNINEFLNANFRR